MKPKVYLIRNVDKESLVRAYDALGVELIKRVAVKIHTGEAGNQNYLTPDYVEPLIKRVKGTVVECNTAYSGQRNTTTKHKQLIIDHGWNKFKFDLLDEDGCVALKIPNGHFLSKNLIGSHMLHYSSMLVVSHFKGHPMAGYGGALKQLSIGCASSEGKAYIHSAGKTEDQYSLWDRLPAQNDFLDSMAESASCIVEHYKGNIAFINVMKNMSVDCDCCAVAEDPCLKDIGILASLDPVAIDQACIDLVKASEDVGRQHFMDRVTSRNGERLIATATALGVGSPDYELIEL